MSDVATILIADDDPVNQAVLTHQLHQLGYRCLAVGDGAAALAALQAVQIDLVLMDVMMPRLGGFAVLQAMKQDSRLFWVPALIISAYDDQATIMRGLTLGADDYLGKPWSLPLLQARITAALARKAAHDQEQLARAALQREQERTNMLLHQIFPAQVVRRLLADEGQIADAILAATVIFADLVDFTSLSAQLPAARVVTLLNEIFCRFDDLAEACGVETIKTQGDAYVAAAGVPTPREDHAVVAVQLAWQMQEELRGVRARSGLPLHMRVGLHSGPLVAGAIGRRKLSYDIWGDTVNIASRMESHGVVDAVQVSAATYLAARERFAFVARGSIDIKGKGAMAAYLLAPPALPAATCYTGPSRGPEMPCYGGLP
jgi:class 3 adenylate cyclase